jgi:transposase
MTTPSLDKPVLPDPTMEAARRLLGVRLFRNGRSFRDVAKKTGVSIGTISKILDPAGAANKIAKPNIEKLNSLLKICRARLTLNEDTHLYELTVEALD